MKSSVRSISLLITAAMLLAVFAGCGGTGSNDTASVTTAEAETATETTPAWTTAIPDDLNFDGGRFAIYNLATGSYYYQIYSEELDGEVLNDAIYNRNEFLQSKYNFKMSENLQKSVSVNDARSMILAGDNNYELIVTVDRDAWTLATEGLARAYSDIPYIDLEREWWSQTVNEDISVYNRLFYSYGDYNLTCYSSVNVLMFNLGLAENYGLNDYYKTVRDGSWTLERFYADAQLATTDLNGDGVFTIDDQYGITSHNKQMLPCFWIGSGLRTITKNSEDEPQFALVGNEKFSSFYMDFSDRMHNGNVWFNTKVLPDYADCTVFKENRALFNVVRTHFIMRFYRDMEQDFGIIPFPKWDEAQEQYCSRSEGGCFNIVPISIPEESLDLIGAVMEVMSAYSREYVVPVYYETLLKDKFARDADSLEMLDLIFNYRIYDLGDTIWCNYIRDGVFAGMFDKHDLALESKIASMDTSISAVIASTLELFAGLE